MSKINVKLFREDPAAYYTELGAKTERDRIVELAKNRICFDHKDNCEHGACYALCDLIELIKGEQK